MEPYNKKGGLFAKVVPKHEHIFYFDPVESILMGELSTRTRRCVWDPIYAKHIIFKI